MRETIIGIDVIPHLGIAGVHTNNGHTIEVSIDCLLSKGGPSKGGAVIYDSAGIVTGWEPPQFAPLPD